MSSTMVAPERRTAGPLASRLWQYQKERFPLAAYLPMVVVFTASAAAYSRLARGAAGWIPWDRFAVGAFTALVFFAWLRLLDEHKDAHVDRRYRSELPVPRGLVTLAELRRVGLAALALALLLNALVAPRLLLAIALVALWAALMTREFFAPEWLRARPTLYLVSHMLIMPLIDFYTTGLDWLAAGVAPSGALALFLSLTFLNGVVVEVGRKLRAPGAEREGVDPYTKAWGLRAAPLVWLAVLAATATVAALALRPLGAGAGEYALLALLAAAAAGTGLAFLARPSESSAKRVETASGLWTIAMYLLLGVGQLLLRAL
jgi:4-hydroxybenzoate polyprenyltransferase